MIVLMSQAKLPDSNKTLSDIVGAVQIANWFNIIPVYMGLKNALRQRLLRVLEEGVDIL